jgi:hypothetical protein
MLKIMSVQVRQSSNKALAPTQTTLRFVRHTIKTLKLYWAIQTVLIIKTNPIVASPLFVCQLHAQTH